MLSETFYNYNHFDTFLNKMMLKPVPDSEEVKIEYDSLNKVFKKKRFNSKGMMTFDLVATTDPLHELETMYSPDNTVMVCEYFYDKPYIANKIVSTIHLRAKGVESYTYTYKNDFDKTGRILSRKVSADNFKNDPNSPFVYFKREEYKYMLGGLLISKTSSKLNDMPGWQMRQLFTYKYWE